MSERSNPAMCAGCKHHVVDQAFRVWCKAANRLQVDPLGTEESIAADDLVAAIRHATQLPRPNYCPGKETS